MTLLVYDFLVYKDIFLANKLIVFSYFSGSKSFLTCGANNTSRILCLHPWWKGQRIFLEETNIQDYRTLRWTYPWLFQDCWVFKTIGIMLNIEREEFFHYNLKHISVLQNLMWACISTFTASELMNSEIEFNFDCLYIVTQNIQTS